MIDASIFDDLPDELKLANWLLVKLEHCVAFICPYGKELVMAPKDHLHHSPACMQAFSDARIKWLAKNEWWTDEKLRAVFLKPENLEVDE